MAKTGANQNEGTAEGAVLGRAAHARHDADPVFHDTWAEALLTDESRRSLDDPNYWARAEERGGFDSRPILAVALGCFQRTEECVDDAFARGTRQYVILGAGFDTFALRRSDLVARTTDPLRVFEVDFPDVQELKRSRVAAAERKVEALPDFVPIDFETTSLQTALAASSFDRSQPAVFSWLNTVPYISEEAVAATISDVAALSAPGSELILNYSPAVPFSESQLEYLKTLLSVTSERSEPLKSRFEPGAMETLLEERGFEVAEHLSEDDLADRYFADRPDGLRPGLPARAVRALRRD